MISVYRPLGLVPPVRLRDSFISSGKASNCGYHSQIIFLNDLLHHLDTSQVSQHVAMKCTTLAFISKM